MQSLAPKESKLKMTETVRDVIVIGGGISGKKNIISYPFLSFIITFS